MNDENNDNPLKKAGNIPLILVLSPDAEKENFFKLEAIGFPEGNVKIGPRALIRVFLEAVTLIIKSVAETEEKKAKKSTKEETAKAILETFNPGKTLWN